MTNLNIILSEAVHHQIITEQQLKVFLEKGLIPPFLTFQEWKKRGYIVKKGQKAKFSCYIWMPKTNKKDKEEKQQTNEMLGSSEFYRKLTHIFTIEQVEKLKG